MTTVYLNGEYVDASQASISVFDRGFLFGDSIYEVVPVYAKRCFRLREHLVRLRQSLAGVDITLGLTDLQLEDIINKIVNSNAPETDSGFAIYLQITRGIDTTRDHQVKPELTPSVFVCPVYPNKPNYGNGLDITTAEDIRWQHCSIKATTLLPNILINEDSRAAGYQDVILFRGEQLTEAVASNVFLVKGGAIFTPKKDTTILGGITRDFVIELAKAHRFKVVETDLTKKDVFSADEVWLTSSNKEIAPVRSINGELVNTGEPGPVWHEMSSYYRDAIRALVQNKQAAVND